MASAAQAKSVAAKLGDPAEFDTKAPFATVAKSSKYFDATNYWRGPVWFDQAYFAINGLERYGYGSEAKTLTNQLLSNAQGLMGDGPFRENYNPLTGAGLNSTNFSWTAALFLSLNG